jgi:hypothetical protein
MALELDGIPKYDEPISPEDANGYVQNYLNNEKFKPADFTAFYFHTDELQKVINENKGSKYIKFTLGMKYLLAEGVPNNVLYGCVMMSNVKTPVGQTLLVADDEGIYDYSHPVPPYRED